MNSKTGTSALSSSHRTSNLAFRTISLMHDNPLLPLFRDPYKLLEAAGLEKGQKVLEVGCGPGYFTIPAAKIVGPGGFVYAVDVHPGAVERVRRKIDRGQIENVKAILANASRTGLADYIIDLAFVFGLRYIAGGLENLLAELHRVLNNDGILSFEKTGRSEKELVAEVGRLGFTGLSKKGRILSFSKCGSHQPL